MDFRFAFPWPMTVCARLEKNWVFAQVSFFTDFIGKSGAKDQSDYVLAVTVGFILILGTLAIWIHHSNKRIIVRSGQLVQYSLFGEKTVKLNSLTSITCSTIKNDGGAFGSMGGMFGVAGAAMMALFLKNKTEGLTTHINIIVSDGTSSIKIDSNFKDVAKLRNDFVAFEMATVLPRLGELYRRGQAVSFGPIKIQRGQLISGSKRLPLRSISDMSVQNGKLVIKKRGKRWPFLKLATSKVTNINSFMALARDSGEYATK